MLHATTKQFINRKTERLLNYNKIMVAIHTNKVCELDVFGATNHKNQAMEKLLGNLAKNNVGFEM